MLGLAAIALAALVAFFVRQRRAANPLYDLKIAGRRIFWVAACAGIIVFGSLMAAMFVSQQYLQNVLGYSTLEAGAAILPAALVMVVVAPRSAKLIEARGSRFTLLCGYVFLFLAFLWMLLIWDEGSPYWQIAAAYIFVGAGVGLAGTPASHSLTGSVPVTRAGMASGTADLQRDLGGAIMQSIFGALLTAGYASAVSAEIAASDKNITRLDAGAAHEVVRRRRGSRAAAPAVRRRDHRRREGGVPAGRRLGVHGRRRRDPSRRRPRLLHVPEARRGGAIARLVRSAGRRPSRGRASSAPAGAVEPRPMSWSVAFRLRRYLRESLWVVPLVGGALGWTLGLHLGRAQRGRRAVRSLGVLGVDGGGGARRGRGGERGPRRASSSR